jgi:nucleoside-diphosphate-sugar epimerase
MALWQTHKFPAVVLRPTVAYGPNQDLDMFIPALISSLLKNQDFCMTDGSQTRDFIFIDDVISAIVRAINIDVAGQVINISSGTEVSLSTLVELVLKIIDTDVRKHVLKAILPRRHGEVGRYVATNGLAKDILGWAPTVDLESGLTQTINWYSNSLEV